MNVSFYNSFLITYISNFIYLYTVTEPTLKVRKCAIKIHFALFTRFSSYVYFFENDVFTTSDLSYMFVCLSFNDLDSEPIVAFLSLTNTQKC